MSHIHLWDSYEVNVPARQALPSPHPSLSVSQKEGIGPCLALADGLGRVHAPCHFAIGQENKDGYRDGMPHPEMPGMER